MDEWWCRFRNRRGTKDAFLHKKKVRWCVRAPCSFLPIDEWQSIDATQGCADGASNPRRLGMGPSPTLVGPVFRVRFVPSILLAPCVAPNASLHPSVLATRVRISLVSKVRLSCTIRPSAPSAVPETSLATAPFSSPCDLLPRDRDPDVAIFRGGIDGADGFGGCGSLANHSTAIFDTSRRHLSVRTQANQRGRWRWPVC